MTHLRELYRCEICKNVVEVVNEGAPDLTCCDQRMEKLIAKTADEGKEKHVPVIEEISGGIKVKVGNAAHPMEEKHYIKFIEVETSSQIIRAELKPGQAPEAVFQIKKEEVQVVREFCTVHMLWNG